LAGVVGFLCTFFLAIAGRFRLAAIAFFVSGGSGLAVGLLLLSGLCAGVAATGVTGGVAAFIGGIACAFCSLASLVFVLAAALLA
jgi:hypothetical protein